jgi:hypothetical protein
MEMKTARQHADASEPASWTIYNLVFALQNAAEFLENEPWPVVDQGVQAAANMEAAKRIRAITDRLVKKHFGGWDGRQRHPRHVSTASAQPHA